MPPPANVRPVPASSPNAGSASLKGDAPRRESRVQRDNLKAVYAAAGLYDEFDIDEGNDNASVHSPPSPPFPLPHRSSLFLTPSHSRSSSLPLSADAEQLFANEREASHAFNGADYARALSLFSLALSFSVSVGPLPYASLLVKRSMTFSALDLHDKALDDADKAIMLHPSSPLAHYQRAMALQGQGRLHHARDALLTASSCSSEENKRDPEGDDEAETIKEGLAALNALLAEMADTSQRLDASSPHQPALRRRLSALCEWLLEGGASFPFLHVHTRRRNRSVHVLTTLPAGTAVLSVPLHRVVTLAQAVCSPVGRALTARGFPSSFSHSLVACFLHYHMQCGDASPLRAYLALLPPLSAYSSLPIFYPASTLRMWEGTSVPGDSAAMMRELRDEFDLILSTLSPPTSLLTTVASLFRPTPPPTASSTSFDAGTFVATLSFEQFLRCRCYIMSRAFALPLGVHGSSELCLVPYADLLDHSEGTGGMDGGKRRAAAEVRWAWDGAQQRLVMRTVGAALKGEELRHNYGAKSNRRWLLHYGLVLSHNAHNAVQLVVAVPSSLPSSAHKRALLALVPGLDPPTPSTGTYTVEVSSSPVSATSLTAFAVLRVVHATPEELAQVEVGSRGALSAENEASVLAYIAHSARVALGALGGDDGEDEARLRKGVRKATKSEEEDARLRREREWLSLRYIVAERRLWRWWAALDDAVKARRTRRKTEEDEVKAAGDNQGDVQADQEVDAYWSSVWLPLLSASDARVETLP